MLNYHGSGQPMKICNGDENSFILTSNSQLQIIALPREGLMQCKTAPLPLGCHSSPEEPLRLRVAHWREPRTDSPGVLWLHCVLQAGFVWPQRDGELGFESVLWKETSLENRAEGNCHRESCFTDKCIAGSRWGDVHNSTAEFYFPCLDC